MTQECNIYYCINIIFSPISFSPKDIAGQLTIIQAGLLAKLSTGELMDKNWEDPIKSPGLKEILYVVLFLTVFTTIWAGFNIYIQSDYFVLD